MAKKKLSKVKKKTATLKKAASKKPRKKTTAKRTISKRKSKKVLAIPKGYNNISPYMIMANAAKAIDFYKKIFGAKEVLRMGGSDGKVTHAELKIGDSKIMLADEFPEMGALGPGAYNGSPVSIHLYVKNVDDVVTRAVSAGAKLLRPVEDRFYGDRSGFIQDPFGHKWSVSTHVADVSPAQIRKRAAELFGKTPK